MIEISNQLKAKVKDKLITARVGLLFKAPFYGALAIRLTLVEADDWCHTAATDGVRFYYNHEFIEKLNPKELQFLFGHEILHVVYDHMARKGSRDHDIFNVACDYAVNLDLVNNNIGEKPTSVPCLYETKYAGLASEEIYELIKDEIKQKQQSQSGQSGQNNDQQGGSGNSELDKLIDQLLDQHIDPSKQNNENESNSNNDGGSSSGPVKMTEEERRRARDEMKEAIINAASQCQASNLPLGVRRLINDLTNPQMDWRELLQMHLDGITPKDYSWTKPSRTSWHIDAILPGMIVDQELDICVAIDTSGSISDEQARDFLSEVAGIMAQYDEYKIHVWCFDTEVHNPQIFTSDNLEDIVDYEVKGGGGTNFQANYDFMIENDIHPKRLVWFTDGYDGGTPLWGDPNYADSLFVIHGNDQIVPPYGSVAYYTFNKK